MPIRIALLLLITLLMAATNGLTQTVKHFPHINNKTVKFSLTRRGVKFLENNELSASKLLIKVILTPADRIVVNKMSSNDWIHALNDSKTDWAANLLLYDLYEKDALIFKVNKSRKEWIVLQRQEDIEYWEHNLKK